MIGCIVLAIVIILVALFYLTRRGRIYVSHDFGFTSFGGTPEPSKKISLDQLKALLPHLIEGRRFDFLWISIIDDRYQGISLCKGKDGIEISTQFRLNGQEDKVASFKAAMAGQGLRQTEEHPWNVGLGPEMESLTVSYHLPDDAAQIYDAALAALRALLHDIQGFVYVTADTIGDGPSDGITYKARRDPLAGLI